MAPHISLLPVRAKATQSTAPRPTSPPLDLNDYIKASPPPTATAARAETPQDVDMSVLDFSELLQGNTSALSAGLLNDESFVFGGDETLATVVGGGLMDESMLELEDVQDEAVPEQEEVVEPLVVLEPVVEPIQAPEPPKAAARPRKSLAPLPPVAVSLPPSPPPAALAPLPPTQQEHKLPAKRPRTSLSRPAHVLPKGHPSHPRASVAYTLPAPVVEVEEEAFTKQLPAPVKQAEPKRSALKQSSSASDLPSAKPPPPPASQPIARLAVPSFVPEPQSAPQSLHSSLSDASTPSSFSHKHDGFPSPGLPFDGDSSLPQIGLPLDLLGLTSTPARPSAKSRATSVPAIQEEAVVEQSVPAPQARRTTMAVTFALPDLEESREMVEVPQTARDEVQDVSQSSVQPATTATTSTLKRRASRAFEGAYVQTAFAEQEVLSAETEVVSRASGQLAPAGLAASKRRASQGPAPTALGLMSSREATAEQHPSPVDSESLPPTSNKPIASVSTATVKRRASRAFEHTATLELPPTTLSSSTSRRASRAFASAPPNISDTPGQALHPAPQPSTSSRRLSSTLPPGNVEPPRTVIRLTASASSSRRRSSTAGRAPPSVQPVSASLPAPPPLQSSTTAPTASKPVATASNALTLPRDFDFLNRGAEREAERKKRAVQREKEREIRLQEERQKKKRKVASAWAAPAGKQSKGVEQGNEAKRAKLSVSLPPGWPTGAPPATSTILDSSAPAPRQPRSRPLRLSTSERRRSTTASSDPFAELSSSSTALTREALEASASSEGPRIDFRRRVSTYLEGVLPGVLEGEEEEEERSYVAEERMVEAASSAAQVLLASAPPTVDDPRSAPARVVPPAPAAVLKAAGAPPRPAPAARRPLVTTNAHNQLKVVPALNAANPPTAAKPATKVQPFVFGSTSHRSRPRAAPTGTASPIFAESLSVWKKREAAVAGGAAVGKRLPSRLSKPKPMGVLADAQAGREQGRVEAREKEGSESKETVWALTEQRRLEREAWEKKQREREEVVKQLKESQRREQAEQERLKLKALRDALVIRPHPIPASTYERKVARRA